MADNKNPRDDHIEDLLSQLQGIFGKLSREEEDESKEKLDASALKGSLEPTPPAPMIPVPEKVSTPAPPPTPPPASPPPVDAGPSSAGPTAPSPEPAAPEPAASTTVYATVPLTDASQLATVVAFPTGRENEAKALSSKLETITPKFTKVSFRLKVVQMVSYDPKGDWKDPIVQQAITQKGKTLFVILDRPLEDAKRKALIADVEKNAMYFQEVPLLSIEKKAFYTDILLGLVFFMDSQKPGQPEQAA